MQICHYKAHQCVGARTDISDRSCFLPQRLIVMLSRLMSSIIFMSDLPYPTHLRVGPVTLRNNPRHRSCLSLIISQTPHRPRRRSGGSCVSAEQPSSYDEPRTQSHTYPDAGMDRPRICNRVCAIRRRNGLCVAGCGWSSGACSSGTGTRRGPPWAGMKNERLEGA